MRRIVPLALACCCLAASASAHAIHLTYGDCEAAGPPNAHAVTLDCSSNTTAPAELVASVVLSSAIPSLVGVIVHIDFQSTGTSLPNWWRFDSAGCRAAGGAVGRWNDAAGVSCPSIWRPVYDAGRAPFSIEQWQLGIGGGNRIRYNGAAAVELAYNAPQTDPATGSSEWGVMRLEIGFGKTAGADACAGCSAGICAVLTQMTLQYGPDGTLSTTLYAPSAGGSWIAFNGGAPVCPGATPTRNSTWGAIKSQYR